MRLLLAIPLFAALGVGCSASTDDSVSAGQGETVTTHPTGGVGTVTFAKPDWYDATVFAAPTLGVFDEDLLTRYMDATGSLPGIGASGHLADLGLGASTNAAPGSYILIFMPKDGFATPGLVGLLGAAAVSAGQASTVTPAGIVAEPDQPIVWPGPGIAVAHVGGPGSAFVQLTGGKLSSPEGDESVDTIVLDGQKKGMLVTPGVYTIDDKSVTLAPGQLLALPVKTTQIVVNLDPENPAFPTSRTMGTCVRVEHDEPIQRNTVTQPIRTTVPFTHAVVPEGFAVRVVAYGIDAQPTTANGVTSFTLDRLQLDDVAVDNSKVRGTAQIEYKTAGGYSTLDCSSGIGTSQQFATGTGVDLPAGTYRITSTAPTASGPVTSTEEVTLP